MPGKNDLRNPQEHVRLASEIKAEDAVGEAFIEDRDGEHGLHEGAGSTAPNATKPYTNSRPSYGKTQVNDVWNSKVNPETGTVRDPSDADITWDRTAPRKGQWDMGHIPGQKYSDIHSRYMRGEITQKEFLEWYRNPANYRPELPSTNRSHKFE